MHNPKEKSMTCSLIRDGKAFLEYELIDTALNETYKHLKNINSLKFISLSQYIPQYAKLCAKKINIDIIPGPAVWQ